ncbi:MAG TPA: hypothetical protein VM537_02200 [Anaerolineae bacterium]|nr:hypothetical protein [Anaerolineae bacterium]
MQCRSERRLSGLRRGGAYSRTAIQLSAEVAKVSARMAAPRPPSMALGAVGSDAREVEIQLRLPEERAEHVEAAARIGALGSIVVLARQFLLVNGRGRRPQTLQETGVCSAR